MKKAGPKMASIPEAEDALDYLYKKDREDKSMIWKVPGQLTPMGKMDHEKAKERREFDQKSLAELKDLLSRQEHLLGNRSLVSRLPDKGEKARARRDEILKRIGAKEREDDLTEKMAGLGIGKLIDTGDLIFSCILSIILLLILQSSCRCDGVGEKGGRCC